MSRQRASSRALEIDFPSTRRIDKPPFHTCNRKCSRERKRRNRSSSPTRGRSVQSGQVVAGTNDRSRWLAPVSTPLWIVAYILVFGLIWEGATVALRPPDYLLPPLHSVLRYFA